VLSEKNIETKFSKMCRYKINGLPTYTSEAVVRHNVRKGSFTLPLPASLSLSNLFKEPTTDIYIIFFKIYLTT
jgi:hypothetical protein